MLDSPATLPRAGSSAPGEPGVTDVVDLWSARVDAPDSAAVSILDRDERARAERFRSPIDRHRYIGRHIFLRKVLAVYLDTIPSEVRIITMPRGRPELDGPPGIDFSTSHSDGCAIVAVSRHGRVGVDIERIRRLDDALDVAEGCMTAREVAWLRTVPVTARSAAFLDLWTRKEAAVKAIGVGLALPLDRFDTGEPGPDGASRPSGLPGDPAMWIARVAGLQGFVAAVALHGHRPVIRYLTHSEVAA